MDERRRKLYRRKLDRELNRKKFVTFLRYAEYVYVNFFFLLFMLYFIISNNSI